MYIDRYLQCVYIYIFIQYIYIYMHSIYIYIIKSFAIEDILMLKAHGDKVNLGPVILMDTSVVSFLDEVMVQ